jgi:hypothetical protein
MIVAPVVSVIIPTYNRWPMVREAVESVLSQRYGDFETIVVDDGSTDGSAEKLAMYRTALRLVVQANRGVAAARNVGASVATGKYLAFLDSDDLWSPKKLAIQTAFMQQKPGVAICQTEEIWLRRGVRVNPKAKHRKPSGDIFRPSLDLCLVSPSAVMMTKELFERMGGFDVTFPVCEDYDLWLRIAVEHAVPLISMPLITKRGGQPDQLSHSLWGMDRFRIRALLKLLRTGLVGEKRGWVLEALRHKTAVVAQGARKRGRVQEAQHYEQQLSEILRGTLNARVTDSRFCERQGVPAADASALAKVESTR